MTSSDLGPDPDCVPEAGTLPTIEHPLRLAEFDGLFTSVTDVDRADATHVTLTLAGGTGSLRERGPRRPRDGLLTASRHARHCDRSRV